MYMAMYSHYVVHGYNYTTADKILHFTIYIWADIIIPTNPARFTDPLLEIFLRFLRW